MASDTTETTDSRTGRMADALSPEPLTRFIRRHKIRMVATMVDSNPNMNDMPAGSTHWRCVFRCRSRQMTIPFSQGPAISRKPEAADVLDCLASDAAEFENARSFEEWASEYGYDEDSRKAEKVYNAVERQTNLLRRFLSGTPGAFEDLLWRTERL
jgi:hypothetical protein